MGLQAAGRIFLAVNVLLQAARSSLLATGEVFHNREGATLSLRTPEILIK
jgi:hypothetical protein